MTRCVTQHSKQTSFLQGFTTYEQMLVGWDNVVTCYRLDGVVIGTQWRQGFLHPSRPALGHTQPLIQWVLGLIPKSKGAMAW